VAVNIQIDTKEFNSALRDYIKVSRRSIAEIVNKRAVNIAFKAIRHTPKALKSKINRELKAKSKLNPKAPLGAILVNKGRKPGLYGEAMTSEIEALKQRRARTIGFIKSGWLGAVKDLQPHAKVFRRPPRVNVQGPPKGYGKPARSGLNPTAEIVNQVAGAVKIGASALQRAINEDAIDMRDFTAKRMQQDANKYNAR
jgi:hypothetical protein